MKKIYFLVLALPVLGILGLIANTEYQLKQGETLLVEIAGYDPRDMLKGHYLNFRFKWHFDETKTKAYANDNKQKWSSEDYLCVIGKGKDYKTYPVKLEDAFECSFLIRGNFFATGDQNNEFFFNTGVEEFYIPEEHSKELEKLLREKPCAMEIQLNHQMRPLLKELYIDGRPWRQYLP